MRTSILTLALIVSRLLSHAQDGKLHTIGLTLATSQHPYFASYEGLDGAGSTEVNPFLTYGITTTWPAGKKGFGEAGIEYLSALLTHTSDGYPGSEPSTRQESLTVVSIPISYRVPLLKYIFLNTGLMLDIQSFEDDRPYAEVGLGLILGVGFQYDFKKGVSAFVNPMLKEHDLITVINNGTLKHLGNPGLRFGVLINLRKE